MLDYGARFYDPAIARFTTIDPLAEDYTFQTPYAYAANNPIIYIDYMGMGPENIIIKKGNTKSKSYNSYVQKATFNHLQSLTSQKLSMDSKSNVTIVSGQGNTNASSESTSNIEDLIGDNKNHVITSDGSKANIRSSELKTGSKTVPGDISSASDGTGTSSTIYFDPEVSATMCNTDCETVSVSANRVLGHEIAHAFNIMMGIVEPKGTIPEGNYPRDKEEQNATRSENKMFEEQRYDGTNENN